MSVLECSPHAAVENTESIPVFVDEHTGTTRVRNEDGSECVSVTESHGGLSQTITRCAHREDADGVCPHLLRAFARRAHLISSRRDSL